MQNPLLLADLWSVCWKCVEIFHHLLILVEIPRISVMMFSCRFQLWDEVNSCQFETWVNLNVNKTYSAETQSFFGKVAAGGRDKLMQSHKNGLNWAFLVSIIGFDIWSILVCVMCILLCTNHMYLWQIWNLSSWVFCKWWRRVRGSTCDAGLSTLTETLTSSWQKKLRVAPINKYDKLTMSTCWNLFVKETDAATCRH